MSREARRGCGYRKVGGLYLCGGRFNVGCERLPIELHVCPTCQGGIKQTRGWIWVPPVPILANGNECNATMSVHMSCPLANPASMGERVGLLWIGERFYPEASDFMDEARALGVSRRIKALPRGFVLGEHWVFIAHPRAIRRPPQTDAERAELTEDNKRLLDEGLPERLYIIRKGIISIFKPSALEKIVTDSEMANTAAMDALRAKGITPVAVPDDDRHHQGSVFDTDEPAEEGAT